MVEVTDTTLRDAHQSLISTRLSVEDAVEIAKIIDGAGFYSLEVWGGATFDVDLRYLRVDPWRRLEEIRSVVKKTKLQMLLRGQNLVGYRHYPDDVVEAFVGKAFEKGVDVFRVFDALNDVRNLKTAIRAAKRAGAIVQGALVYTVSPVHTVDYYLKVAEQILSLDVDIVTIKDMAGLLDPYTARELVARLKKDLGARVSVHTHDTNDLAPVSYFAAIEAGADFIDTSIYPLAYGTAQPAIQSVYYVLPPADREKINLDLIEEASSLIRRLLEEKYAELYKPSLSVPDPRALRHQIPGGMYSNMLYQLKELGALDKLREVLEEVPRVRRELGWPPLVTPISQIVGAQAVLNVVSGERYGAVVRELVDYVSGAYGQPPAPIDPEVKKRVLATASAGSPKRRLSLEECRSRVAELLGSARDEDALTYCLFPEVAESALPGIRGRAR